MRLGIRIKVLGIIGVASVLPLLIGLISIQVFGYRYYAREKGALYQSIARDTASRLERVVGRQVDRLDAAITFSEIGALLAREGGVQPPIPQELLTAPVADVDRRWALLDENDPLIRGFLTNNVARELQAFQVMNEHFAEIFVTDAAGRLVAATNKTSDYMQADEDWWRQAARLGRHQAWVEGVQFDDSAKVLSLDVAMPILPNGVAAGRPVGVIKGVLNVSKLLTSLPRSQIEQKVRCHVVLEDGRILVGLFKRDEAPLTERISPGAFSKLSSDASGWFVGTLLDGPRELAGFAPLQWTDIGPEGARSRLSPMRVVVHDDAAVAFAPIRRQLWWMTTVGALLLLLLIGGGLYFADRRIIAPLKLLDAAAQSIEARSKLRAFTGETERRKARLAQQRARTMLERVGSINTGDEIQQLARGFQIMAQRVLNYHEQLEKEIDLRTRDVEHDLNMAREFMELFLPRSYPEVPGPGEPAAVGLNFYHVYKPAYSVGGDFFDISKLSERQAGVFMADVMGHGARSALITAILRALLKNFSPQTADPGQLMTLVNQRFYDLMPHERSMIFASAFYLVIDTVACTVECTSAGHPAPLLLDRATGKVAALHDDETDPALGLFPDTTYATRRRTVKAGDVVLLYTDGVIEAPNPAEEEFGLGRLKEVARENLHHDAKNLSHAILEALHGFMDTVVSPDDICLVTIEMTNHHG